jgi:LacI family transcriptional regulator
LEPAGYSALFVSGHWDEAIEKRCIDTLKSRRVDGLIILNGRMGDAELKALAKALPVVVTGRAIKAPGLGAFDFHNVEGARLATQHLIDLGHRDIAHLSGDVVHPDARERLEGYRLALEAAGLPYRPELVETGMYFEDGGRDATQRLLDRGARFTAIFAANDQMAFGASVVLHKQGLRVPEDVSLVGFDDLAQASYMAPPLSTVHQASHELGRAAAQGMLALLAGEKPALALPEPRLIVRDSTGPAPRSSQP